MCEKNLSTLTPSFPIVVSWANPFFVKTTKTVQLKILHCKTEWTVIEQHVERKRFHLSSFIAIVISCVNPFTYSRIFWNYILRFASEAFKNTYANWCKHINLKFIDITKDYRLLFVLRFSITKDAKAGRFTPCRYRQLNYKNLNVFLTF